MSGKIPRQRTGFVKGAPHEGSGGTRQEDVGRKPKKSLVATALAVHRQASRVSERPPTLFSCDGEECIANRRCRASLPLVSWTRRRTAQTCASDPASACGLMLAVQSRLAKEVAVPDSSPSMFTREAEMTPNVVRWMTSVGLQVRSEFQSPWGICDLVGICFNVERVAHRVALRQTGAVGSVTRAALLLALPDAGTRRSLSLEVLKNKFGDALSADVVSSEIEKLKRDGFVITTKQGHLQKLNGWMPIQDRLVAVELKLTRIFEAFQQARANQSFAAEAYVAFPADIAKKVAAPASSWQEHLDHGVGVVSVEKRRCEVLVPARPLDHVQNAAVQLYCADKFWRSRERT